MWNANVMVQSNRAGHEWNFKKSEYNLKMR